MVKKILIFGAGSVGAHHANACRYFKYKVYITDINQNQLEYFKKNLYPSRYNFWDSSIELIDYTNVFKNNIFFDLVIIATSPNQHINVIKSVNKKIKFKKMLVEKPICVYNQINTLKHLKLKNKKNIYCGFNHELSDSIIELKKYVTLKKKHIRYIKISWKESFSYLLKAHPWIKSIKESYLSNVESGGGALHEFSHAIHLMNNIANNLYKKDSVQLKSKIKFRKLNINKFDYLSIIDLNYNGKSIKTEINSIRKPPLKKIEIYSKNEVFIWLRNQIDGKEIIYKKTNSKIKYKKVFLITRPKDFITQIKKIFSKKNIDLEDLKCNNFKNSIKTMQLIKRCLKNY